MNHKISLLLALTLGLPGVNAFAQTGTSSLVELSGLKITLVDLLPNDGIAPSIEFGAGGTAMHIDTVDQTGPYQEQENDFQDAFHPGNVSLPQNAEFSVILGNSGSIADGTQSMRVSQHMNDLPAGDSRGALMTATGKNYVSFQLSPGTRVYFSGMASLTATPTLTPAEDGSSFAAASLSGELFSDPFYGSYVSSHASLYVGVPYGATRGRHIEQELDLSFDNTSAVAEFGTFTEQLNVGGSLRPIPEPGTLLLMCGGLLALGMRKLGASRLGGRD